MARHWADATPADLFSSGWGTPVEYVFGKVDQALRVVEASGGVPWVFKVQFDPALGYPVYYEENCYEVNSAGPCPTDSFSSARILRLEVITRRQP